MEKEEEEREEEEKEFDIGNSELDSKTLAILERTLTLIIVGKT